MKTYRILDTETNEIYERTLTEIIAMINEDHSDEWLNYGETDWLEGWLEWCEGFPYILLDKETLTEKTETK